MISSYPIKPQIATYIWSEPMPCAKCSFQCAHVPELFSCVETSLKLMPISKCTKTNPQPAIYPSFPTMSSGNDGKQIGKMWVLQSDRFNEFYMMQFHLFTYIPLAFGALKPQCQSGRVELIENESVGGWTFASPSASPPAMAHISVPSLEYLIRRDRSRFRATSLVKHSVQPWRQIYETRVLKTLNERKIDCVSARFDWTLFSHECLPITSAALILLDTNVTLPRKFGPARNSAADDTFL